MEPNHHIQKVTNDTLQMLITNYAEWYYEGHRWEVKAIEKKGDGTYQIYLVVHANPDDEDQTDHLDQVKFRFEGPVAILETNSLETVWSPTRYRHNAGYKPLKEA